MAWEDTLLDASFKGITFDCQLTRDSDERDVAEYVYPYRSGGPTDDLGRGIRRFDMTAVFFGGDYEQRLQAFLAVLEEPGPGELIHPIFGSIQSAQLRAKTIEHDGESPDYCTVRLVFLEDGADNPFFVRDLPAGRADSASQFASIVNDLGAQQFLDYIGSLKAQSGLLVRLNAVRDVMGSVLGSIRSVVDSYVTSGADLLNFPSAFVADLGAGVASLVNLRQFDSDSLMPDWSGLVDDLGSVVQLPASLASGNPPARFTNTASQAGTSTGDGNVSAVAIPADAADVTAVTAIAQATTATALADQAADILADQAATPTLSPDDVERIADDTRAALQGAIDTYRDNVPLEQARPICEALRETAAAIQDAAAGVINLLPPLQLRAVQAPANLRLLAFQWYGDHTRAVELARLNPELRYPNDLRAGDAVYGFLR